MSDEDAIAFKIVLVGDAKVGKTSLLGRWAKNEFSDFYEPTVSPELTTRVVSVEGQNFRLQVWDTGFGETDIVAQFPTFARNAAGALLMYDLSDVGSLNGMVQWFEQVRSLTSQTCVAVLVGCKADLSSAPGVEQRVKTLCESLGVAHVLTSAETGRNVSEAFEMLARDMYRQRQARNRGVDMRLPQSLESAAPTTQLNRGVDMQLPSSNMPQSLESTPTTQLGSMPSDQPAYPRKSAESRVKLVLLGEPGVGKSCLAQRLGGDEAALLSEDYIPTAGPEMLTRTAIVNAAPVRLQIWDAPGNDLLQNMKICLPVLRGVDAVIVLYDITVRSTFDSINQWFQLLEAHTGVDVSVLLVGNKADDVVHRAVSTEEGRLRAAMLRVPFMEFSARENSGLAYLLDTLLAGNRPPPDWSGAHAAPPEVPSEAPTPTSTSSTAFARQWQLPYGVAGESEDTFSRVMARARARVEAGLLGVSQPEDGDDGMSVASSRATRSTVEDKRSIDRPSSISAKAARPQEPRQSEPLPKSQGRGSEFLQQSPGLSPMMNPPQSPMMNPGRERSESAVSPVATAEQVELPSWAQPAATELRAAERQPSGQAGESEQAQVQTKQAPPLPLAAISRAESLAHQRAPSATPVPRQTSASASAAGRPETESPASVVAAAKAGAASSPKAFVPAATSFLAAGSPPPQEITPDNSPSNKSGLLQMKALPKMQQRAPAPTFGQQRPEQRRPQASPVRRITPANEVQAWAGSPVGSPGVVGQPGSLLLKVGKPPGPQNEEDSEVDKAIIQLRKRLENAGNILNEQGPYSKNQTITVPVETLSRTQSQAQTEPATPVQIATVGRFNVNSSSRGALIGSGSYPVGAAGQRSQSSQLKDRRGMEMDRLAQRELSGKPVMGTPDQSPTGAQGPVAQHLIAEKQSFHQAPPDRLVHSAGSPPASAPASAMPVFKAPGATAPVPVFGLGGSIKAGSVNLPQGGQGLPNGLARLPNDRVVRAVSPVRANVQMRPAAPSPSATPIRRTGATPLPGGHRASSTSSRPGVFALGEPASKQAVMSNPPGSPRGSSRAVPASAFVWRPQ